MKKNIARRLAKLRARLRRSKLDSILITCQANIRYLSGFTGDSSRLLITRSDAVFLTDFRYVEQIEEECKGFRVARKGVVDEAKKLGVRNVGIEANALSLQAAEQLRKELGKIEMVSKPGLVEEIRTVKDREEIAAIEAAVGAAEKCIEHVKPYLVPGIRERDIVAEMEYFVRGLGFDGMSFPPIVAFGPRGSICHARATNRRLKAGEPVLIDWGVAGDGYVSDLTRVFFHNKISKRFERIYRTVFEAQRRAIGKMRPGVPVKAVDAAARKHIARAGFGKRFGHNVGHGIGLEVHEGPGLAGTSNVVLKTGMVVTVEPGIYIPGLGGVRIEDDVLVTANGARVLSNVPKELKDVVIGG